MIKKNTKLIFEDDGEKVDEWEGGIPLSKGEIITINKNNKSLKYKVKDKLVDCIVNKQEQIVNITYILSKC